MAELECIILAGGMGTRLRSAVPDLPKCMAPVDGKPFLHYLVESLEGAGFSHIIFSLGYMHEAVERWLGTLHTQARISTVVEDSPLGTGGGIRFALEKAEQEDVFVLNGDTWLGVRYREMLSAHRSSGALATLALKRMDTFDRYGTVETRSENGNSFVSAFREKKHCDAGLINGGVYIFKKDALQALPEAFSIETDFFAKEVLKGTLAAYETGGFFLDIGIPEDYSRSQKIFREGLYKPFDTLFLDRDGVINRELVGTYVKTPSEFEFLPGVKDALRRMRPLFSRMVVVTNQRGVVKGLMTRDGLDLVHRNMIAEIEEAGGKIDAVYCSLGMDCSDPMRKPNPGMILKYLEDRPQTDLSRCILAGDKESDMECASRAGVRGIMISPRFTLADLADKLLKL